jgi:hypothetical protein
VKRVKEGCNEISKTDQIDSFKSPVFASGQVFSGEIFDLMITQACYHFQIIPLINKLLIVPGTRHSFSSSYLALIPSFFFKEKKEKKGKKSDNQNENDDNKKKEENKKDENKKDENKKDDDNENSDDSNEIKDENDEEVSYDFRGNTFSDIVSLSLKLNILPIAILRKPSNEFDIDKATHNYVVCVPDGF